MKVLKRAARSPYLHLFSGVVLVMTAAAEFFDSTEDSTFGLHHGVLVAGLVHIVQSLAHIFEGAHDLDEATRALKKVVGRAEDESARPD